MMPDISVIIPVKNGAETLIDCLKAITTQQYNGTIEIIILDSSSTDESVNIGIAYGAKIIKVEEVSFNHGLTRNTGANIATGELLYFTVQDAWISSEDMLEKMALHFEDEEVKSVTGMQAIPHHKNKNPALWFKRSSEPVPEFYQFKKNEFQSLSPIKQKELCCWDNVNAMYRKTALQQQPFIKANLSEDMIWAKQALAKGWKIIRDPSLLVYHYHHHSFSYNFRVNYAVAYENRKIFGIKPTYPSVFIPFMRRVNTIRKNHSMSASGKLYWILHNAAIYFAHTLSAFTFRTALFWGGEKQLKRSLHFFCNSVPQGQQS